MQKTVIQIQLSPEELKKMIREVIREEVGTSLKKIANSQELLSPKEAMSMLNIGSYNTLKSMWRRGDVEMVIIGKRPKIKRESVEEYIKQKS